MFKILKANKTFSVMFAFRNTVENSVSAKKHDLKKSTKSNIHCFKIVLWLVDSTWSDKYKCNYNLLYITPIMFILKNVNKNIKAPFQNSVTSYN